MKPRRAASLLVAAALCSCSSDAYYTCIQSYRCDGQNLWCQKPKDWEACDRTRVMPDDEFHPCLDDEGLKNTVHDDTPACAPPGSYFDTFCPGQASCSIKCTKTGEPEGGHCPTIIYVP